MAGLLNLFEAGALAAPDYLARADRESYDIIRVLDRHFDLKVPLRMMDIGCGFAAVDAYLCQRIPVEYMALLDGDVPGRKQSYTDGAKAWNDVRIGAKVVYHNTKLQAECFFPGSRIFAPNLNFIISLRSWCHHYPAGIYLRQSYNALVPFGIMILDCRTGEGNSEAIQAGGFRVLECLEESPKRQRLVFQRNGN